MSKVSPIVVPQLNVNDETVQVASWLVEHGATVSPGEAVCEAGADHPDTQLDAGDGHRLGNTAQRDGGATAALVRAGGVELFEPPRGQQRIDGVRDRRRRQPEAFGERDPRQRPLVPQQAQRGAGVTTRDRPLLTLRAGTAHGRALSPRRRGCR